MDVDQGCRYIDFEEAYHLYSSFGQFFCPDKQAFRDKLLDEIHGLPVYVITGHYSTYYVQDLCRSEE